jgi:hypothetical protein
MNFYTGVEFWVDNEGFDETFTVGLDNTATYLVETYLTKKDGGDYAHAYIAEVCTGGGDQILCGVNDEGADTTPSLQILSGAVSVTIGLRTTGGTHRSTAVIYSL